MHTTTAGFSPEQLAALSAPLDRAKVQTRQQAGRSLAYLEGWQAIAEANRIFGFDGWQRETIALACVNQSERSIGRDGRSGWGVTYTARVRIRVGAVIREGSGAGHGIDADLGQAHESALKEAETDAMKRALMTFGNQFGLALYDKQQRHVASTELSTPPNTVTATEVEQPKAQLKKSSVKPKVALQQSPILSHTAKAGDTAISKATTLEAIAQLGERLTARHSAGDITDDEHKALLQMLLDREDAVK